MLTFSQLREIVDFAVENATNVLDFSGGEFFAHPFAYELLLYCFSRGIKVNICTNATEIDQTFFEKYKYQGLLTMQISVDGLEQKHDSRRGKGMFEKTIANARRLADDGIPITLSMALDKSNYRDAIEVLKLDFVSEFMFLPVAYSGAAIINDDGVSDDEYEETIVYLLQNTECEATDWSRQLFPYLLAVKYDGSVYPSPVAADYNLLCMGNINNHSMKDITVSFLKSANFRELANVAAQGVYECTICPAKDRCNTGCRMRALKFFGRLQKPDPFYCRLFLNKYTDIPIGRLFWGDNCTANSFSEV